MTTLLETDVLVNWLLSPRVATIVNTINTINLQDWIDTLRIVHQYNPRNLEYPDLIGAVGKDALDTSTSTAITATMENSKMFFEPKYIVQSSGAATSIDTDGTVLINIGATFEADGVTPGAWIYNTTDNAIGTVLAVVSETELLLDGLHNGSNNFWSVSDSYRVWNVIQKRITAGNLIGKDIDDLDVSPILPSALTQVLLSAASAATITTVLSGSGVTPQDIIDIADAVYAYDMSTVVEDSATTFGNLINLIFGAHYNIQESTDDTIIIKKRNGTDTWATITLKDKDGNNVSIPIGSPMRRSQVDIV